MSGSVLDILAPVITVMVNLSFALGMFPDSLNKAFVHPLKKILLDMDIFKNYRPVFNLAFVSKVSEKTVAMRLYRHMDINEFMSIFQSAYKELHSI